MAPRTRATAASAPAPAPLAAAPRRRVKVTSLEKEQPVVEETKPKTRATRSTKSTFDDKATPKPAVQIATIKSRGRPKKADTTVEEVEEEKSAEKLAEKPKRATRSTRATATTASTVAKAKPATRSSRTTKLSKKDEPADEPEPEPQPDTLIVSKSALKKKVTFQDNFEDNKENQPVTTKGPRKTAVAKSTKASEKVTGLRAKPVRNPAATSARATKRPKPDDEDELQSDKPKKIQRILTPKKITQVAKAKIQDGEEDVVSDDELNGGKTPVRDLSMSPRRPHSALTADAMAKTLSPVKKLDLTQPFLHISAKKSGNGEVGSFLSPARRLPVSPAKVFPQSTAFSSGENTEGLSHGLDSPARRPIDSPAKLLFPYASKSEQRVQLSQTSNLLFQSPKRSTLIDPAQMFAQSAVKPQKNNLAKSNFFSSPAKRICIFSPPKDNTICERIPDEQNSVPNVENEIALDEMEVTQLIQHGATEFSVSSHQRASVSPVRTYKLTHDELHLDFDESILPVRSPLKIARSPAKSMTQTARVVKQSTISDFVDDEDVTAPFSSVQNTPQNSTFVSLHNVQNVQSSVEAVADDMTESESGEDETINLPEKLDSATPRPSDHVAQATSSLNAQADFSPRDDLVAQYLQSPTTPDTIYDNEMSDLLSSPQACGTPAAILIQQPDPEQVSEDLSSVAESIEANAAAPAPAPSSPIALHENELTIAGGGVDLDTTTVSLHENELTNMGGTPKAEAVVEGVPRRVVASPVGLVDNELTLTAASFTPLVARKPKTVDMNMEYLEGAEEVSPSSPVSIAEHELTVMGECSVSKNASIRSGGTPAIRPQGVAATPDLPIPRKFSLHTVVSKVPLKPEAQESPFRFQVKKRKRPASFGGQPSQIDFQASTIPQKLSRTEAMEDVTSAHHSVIDTPTAQTPRTTPATNKSSVKSTRRVASTPLARNVLHPSTDSTVLAGAVIFVDVRTSEGADASAIYVDLLSSLGAKVVREWKDNITHMVFKDGSTKILEKARLADVKIVGVSWPLDCEAQQSWLDEVNYAVTLNPVDHLLPSASRSARRKSMEPSLLITDGSGSVKRSRSKARNSTSRRSTIKSLNFDQDGSPAIPDAGEYDVATPQADPAVKQAALEKNSLTAAWKSINATSNLGEDTPARRTLELLQKSYELENNWNDTIISEENDENTPHPASAAERLAHEQDDEDVEDSIIDTGLTPAPFRTKQQIGSAPSKLHNVGLSSYRERVEEMERREMRNNAYGTNKGERGLVKTFKDQGKSKGKRMTMFGFESITKYA